MSGLSEQSKKSPQEIAKSIAKKHQIDPRSPLYEYVIRAGIMDIVGNETHGRAIAMYGLDSRASEYISSLGDTKGKAWNILHERCNRYNETRGFTNVLENQKYYDMISEIDKRITSGYKQVADIAAKGNFEKANNIVQLMLEDMTRVQKFDQELARVQQKSLARQYENPISVPSWARSPLLDENNMSINTLPQSLPEVAIELPNEIKNESNKKTEEPHGKKSKAKDMRERAKRVFKLSPKTKKALIAAAVAAGIAVTGTVGTIHLASKLRENNDIRRAEKSIEMPINTSVTIGDPSIEPLFTNPPFNDITPEIDMEPTVEMPTEGVSVPYDENQISTTEPVIEKPVITPVITDGAGVKPLPQQEYWDDEEIKMGPYQSLIEGMSDDQITRYANALRRGDKNVPSKYAHLFSFSFGDNAYLSDRAYLTKVFKSFDAGIENVSLDKDTYAFSHQMAELGETVIKDEVAEALREMDIDVSPDKIDIYVTYEYDKVKSYDIRMLDEKGRVDKTLARSDHMKGTAMDLLIRSSAELKNAATKVAVFDPNVIMCDATNNCYNIIQDYMSGEKDLEKRGNKDDVNKERNKGFKERTKERTEERATDDEMEF